MNLKNDLKPLRHPDFGLLLIRLMIGAVGIYHGGQKLFGLFGGGGIRGTEQAMASMNIPLPLVSAITIGIVEFFCGILIAIGFYMRIAVLPFAFGMYVAAFYVHGHAFGAQFNGMEFPLTLAVVLTALFFTGAGRYSVHSAVA